MQQNVRPYTSAAPATHRAPTWEECSCSTPKMDGCGLCRQDRSWPDLTERSHWLFVVLYVVPLCYALAVY